MTETWMEPGVEPEAVAESQLPPFAVVTAALKFSADPLLAVKLIVCAAGLLWPTIPLKLKEVGLALRLTGVVTVRLTGIESWLARLPVEVSVTVPL